jgi:hypothetical protein
VATTTVTDTCASCDAELSGLRFCGVCGERKLGREDYSALHFARQALHEVTNLDAKALRSAIALLAQPGHLTSELLAGRRRSYLKPVTVFVLTNVALGWPAPFLFLTRDGVMLPLLAGMAVYHGVAVRKVYGAGRAGSLALAAALPVAEVLIWLYLFRPLSFVATLLLV